MRVPWVPRTQGEGARENGVRMLQETAELEEFDEDIGIDRLDVVDKFLNEDDDSDFVLEDDEVREVLVPAWKQKRQEI